MKKKQSVVICMSTYNGEKYIREQLDSIINQTYQNIYLLIRDDGSTDSTCSIIKEYEERYEFISFINPDERENLRPTKSFLQLIQYAFDDMRHFSFFAFADQDDVWLSDKIARAIEKLDESDASRFGRLYYSNKTIVDQNLNLLYEEHISYYGDYMEVLCRSLAFGCTMVFDRSFAALLSRYMPARDWYHDAWTYRVAKTLGTTIVFDSKSSILYRQHAANVIGAYQKKSAHEYLKSITIKKVVGKVGRMLAAPESDHYTLNQLNEIIDAYQEELYDSENTEVYNCLKHYKESFFIRIKLLVLLRERGLSRFPLITQIQWWHTILNNQI